MGLYSLVAGAIGLIAFIAALFMNSVTPGVILYVISSLGGLVAIVLGIIALVKKRGHAGMAVAGLIIGLLLAGITVASIVFGEEDEQKEASAAQADT